jgi:hypothetical protein
LACISGLARLENATLAAAKITCYVRQYNEFITDVRSVATMESGNPQRYFVKR